jgi:hypothetical protein
MSARDTTLGRALRLSVSISVIIVAAASCSGDKRSAGGSIGTGASASSGAAGLSAHALDAAAEDAGGHAGAAADAGTVTSHVCIVPDDLAIAPAADGGAADPDCHDVPRTIIANSCIGGICHDSIGPPAGMLDLMQPCVADRLVNVVSECHDEFLIDPQQPSASFLLDKIESDHPACGESMPFTGHLPLAQQHCIDAWVHSIARYLDAR